MSVRILQDETDTRDENVVLRETVYIYGGIFFGSLLIWWTIKRYFPKTFRKYFQIRAWVPELYTELATKELSFSELMTLEDLELFENCGFDALCFIRSIRFGLHLSFVSLGLGGALIPIYATARESKETADIDSWFLKISLSNLPYESKRYLGTLLSVYILVFYTLYRVGQELKWYAKFRHYFLSKPWPRNYTVYVQDIPPHIATSNKLYEHFNSIFGGRVLEAHVAVHTPKLESLFRERKTLVRKIEHENARFLIMQKSNPNIKLSKRRIDRDESISQLSTKLQELNKDISKKVRAIRRSHDERRNMFQRSTSLRRLDREFCLSVDAADVPITELANSGSSEPPEAPRPGSPRHPLMRDDGEGIETDLVLDRSKGEESQVEHLQHLILSRDATDPERSRTYSEAIDSIAAAQFQAASESLDHDNPKHLRHRSNGAKGPLLASIESVELFSSEASEKTLKASRMSLWPKKTTSARSSLWSGKSSTSSGRSTSFFGEGKSSSFAPKIQQIKGSLTNAAGAVETLGQNVGGEIVKKTKQIAGKSKELGVKAIKEASALTGQTLGDDGEWLRCGFLVFEDLFSTNAALQMNHHREAKYFNLQESPEPKDIDWGAAIHNMGARRNGRLFAFGLTATLCLFWGVPMAFIASLTSIETLKEVIPGIDSTPRLEALLAQMAPAMLLFMNEVVLPQVLKFFCSYECHISKAHLEASLFHKLSGFMVYNTFFVAVSDSFLKELERIIDSPSDLFEILAQSLPAASSLIIQIFVAQTLLMQTIEMLRIFQIGSAWLRKFIGPNLTEKERKRPSAWGLINSLERPMEFWLAEAMAQNFFLFVALFVYTPTAPIVAPFLIGCFLLQDWNYRYTYIYSLPRTCDTGGKLFVTFIHYILAILLIAEFALLGLLALKQSPYASPSMIPLIVLTGLASIFLNGKLYQVTQRLPSQECALVDLERAGDSVDFLLGQYAQPQLKDDPLEPEAPGEDGDEDIKVANGDEEDNLFLDGTNDCIVGDIEEYL